MSSSKTGNGSVEDGSVRSLHWHVLGGNNKYRIGMNSGLCAYEETDSMGVRRQRNILFDMGVLNGDPKCPEDPSLADSDIVFPDMEKYFCKKDDPLHRPEKKVDSIFLTHSHSDHIGAIPLLALMGYEIPKIYATPYTAKRLEQELANSGLNPDEWPQIYTIAPGKPIQEGPVKVSAFWVSHSTPQSVGFFIETPEGNILTPGDFKLDDTVIWGPSFDEAQYKQIVSKSVDLMLMDSTGADSDTLPIREHDVRETLRDLMEKYPKKRFVIAVMSGFEENLASVAKVASEYGRTSWVSGWAHEQALSALKETGLTLSDSIGQEVDVRVLSTPKSVRELNEAKAGKSVVVVTGAQGMPSAALTRAASGQHNLLTLDPKEDIILFCAPSIPGQEGYRQQLLNTLRNKGYKVLTRQDAPLYSQAHARVPELVEMVKMTKPKVLMPSHGDLKLRRACAETMEKMGQKIISSENGAIIRVTKEGCHEINPQRGASSLIGFKTLQGQSWFDRHYLMTKAPAEKPAAPKPAANGNQKRPQIFNRQSK